MLARARWLPKVRDNEARARYGRRPHAARDELGGKTLLIVRLRQIGCRLAWLAMAFDMRVIGFRHDPRAGAGDADAYTRCPTSTPCCRLAPSTYMRMPAPLAEPAADRNEKIASLHPLDLIAPESRQAHRRS